MKAPAHWRNPPGRPGALARALTPLACIWRAAGSLRAVMAATETAPVPVLCVGNLIAGGSGKTPMVVALIGRLTGQAHAPHVVSRGHGGKVIGPHRVDPARDTADDVGDEPLLLAAHGPVWVARDRAAGARAAAAAGADIVVLDDGFQNPHLAKDASILMVDAVAGFGNGLVIPAGPLREPVEAGLARADLVVLVGEPEDRARALETWPALAGVPLVAARLAPLETGMVLEGDPVFAFAGIGYPEKFFATLRRMGAKLVGTRAFPDHYRYSAPILRRLVSDALARNAMLVTTEKDAVRLPPAFRRDVMTVQVRLEPEDWGLLDRIVDRILAK